MSSTSLDPDDPLEDLDNRRDEDGVLEVLNRAPQVDDALILRLTYDLATKFHKPEILAKRYGMRDRDELKDYLREHPQVVTQARKLHAIFASDESAEERVRMKFLHATENLIIPMAGLVADPHTPLSARIDGFKQIQRGAGLDGAASSSARGAMGRDGQGGHPFNLVINFAGGREKVVLDATTVSDGDFIPDPPPLSSLNALPALTSLQANNYQDDDPDQEDYGETI